MNSKLEKRLAAVESSIVTESVISVIQNCNDMLIERVKHLEVQVLRNSQYARNRQLEIHNVPAIIHPTVLASVYVKLYVSLGKLSRLTVSKNVID